ncbi:hypothetical protein SELMODRAFT_161978 [Selaginella moellendorffii]|uniref:Pentacotripeptide-repeat region of PRORP domain-containing protein n=1 Tax=Selaginella moellendorffii TaxID=88036 RepID=D8T8B6_SELML|nr:hypothetical protein SELMODRAFT_161978 [Selaginella moellendorffii]
MYSSCGSIRDAQIVFEGICKPSICSWNTMVSAYAQCGHVDLAKSLFDTMPHRDDRGVATDTAAWNSMVAAYAKSGHANDAILVFRAMQVDGVAPDAATFVILLTACSHQGLLQQCCHYFVAMSGDHGLTPRDLVASNAMITAYGQQGMIEQALAAFGSYHVRDLVTWNAMIQAFAHSGHLDQAKEYFERMPERDCVSWNTMIQAYANDGCVEEANRLFRRMPEPNLLTWTSLLVAFAQNGNVAGAETIFFARMPEWDAVSCNAMVALYADAGCLARAAAMFDRRDTVSYNTMLAAYAQFGHYSDAFELLHSMGLESVLPNDVSFLIILNACAHKGLLREARSYLAAMADHRLKPCIEHYCIFIDVFGKVGQLENASELAGCMPFQGDGVSWGSLAGACGLHRNVRHGAGAAKLACEMAPKSAASYVSLANLYAA